MLGFKYSTEFEYLLPRYYFSSGLVGRKILNKMLYVCIVYRPQMQNPSLLLTFSVAVESELPCVNYTDIYVCVCVQHLLKGRDELCQLIIISDDTQLFP